MARKIIIDCDPGIDDAVALCIALFDPRLHVLAITATAGTIDADQSTSNVTALLQHLDPARYPRVGKASVPSDAPVVDDKELHGPDGLAGCNFEYSNRQHQHSSDKVISELLRQHPGQITILCLGPLSNLARVCQRDPAVVPLIDQVVISGGAVNVSGNATPAAEFNMYFDAAAAKEVLNSATTKRLVPLDVTEALTFGVELIDRLPPKYTRAGNLLHRLLPFAFRAAHERLGRELIPLYDPTALLAVLEPELFTWEGMAGDVETRGELTRGMTVFDRRLRPEWQENMEVAGDISQADAMDAIVRGIRYAGQHT